MIATRTEAVDAILALVNTVVSAESLYCVWENTDKLSSDDQKPDDIIPWCRVRVLHGAGDRTSLPNQSGACKHELSGQVFVEIMTPLGGGRQEGDRLAQLFETAFRVRSSYNQSVTYSNIYSREAGQDDGWYKINTVARFQYTLIQ